jgi:hypothetical protein
MNILNLIFLAAVLGTPTTGPAPPAAPRPVEIRIALAQKNEFVVKMMEVFDNYGHKIPGLVELVSFSSAERSFIFRNSKRQFQKIRDEEIKEIDFTRLRQGVLTGKPPSLRVNVWNGAAKQIELDYRDVKVKEGYLFLSQKEFFKHFDDSDTVRDNTGEWSDRLHKYWIRQESEFPETFPTNFAFKDGHGIMSRKMAAAYCRACLKTEILKLQIDPGKKVVRIRCKAVFYDKYHE